MMKHFYLKIFLILILTSVQFVGQIKIHKTITTEDGLVQGQISAMLQDKQGYIWIGTFDGISRWDGKNFLSIQTYNGLPASQILDIEEGSDSSIYFASYGGGVLVYKNGILDTINKKDGLLTDGIITIKLLSTGEILFAGDDGNISKLKDGKLNNWSEQIGFPKYDVYGIYESSDGTIYCATENGLVIVENNACRILTEKDGLITNWLWSINGDSNGNVFLGTNGGINILKENKISSLVLNENIFRNAAFKIKVDKNNKVYFATNAGILINNNGKLENITTLNGLPTNDIWSLLEGTNGLLYFGTNGKGISVYDPKEKIINFRNITGLPEEKIYCIEESADSEFYFGTRSGLVIQKNNTYKILTTSKGQRNNIIGSIHKRRNGEILIGTKNGLNLLKGNSITHFINEPNMMNNEIFSIAESDSGKLYVGTPQGLFEIKNNHVKKLEYFDSLGSIYIMAIVSTANDGMFFGSFDKGIYILDNNQYFQLNTENGLSSDRINCLYQTKDGLVLVGTQKGLNVIKDKKVIRVIDAEDGLTNNTIADIHESDDGKIFLSTFSGISVIQNLHDSLTIRNITNKDGLINNNCLIDGSYLDQDGNLWIITQDGISKYNPNKDEVNTTLPKIYLTGLQIFNADFPLNKFLKDPELNHDENYLRFIYTGLNLSAPEQIKYKYRLSGIDKDWVLSDGNSVQYTHLDQGNFVFEVAARNEWGYWSEPVSLAFIINPAWWETWWFRLLFISFISVLLWLAFQYRLNYLLKLERLRTKIASDLHDEVGSLLTQISVNADSLSYIEDSEKIKEKGSFIRSKSTEVINMMSDVIWSIDSRNDNLESLVDRIQNFAQSFLEQKDIALNFSNDIQNLQKTLKIDFRQNIMLIAKEAINNAVKYSDCSKIDIVMNYKNDKFELQISDNGKGFDMQNVKKGNGLKNMKMRAKSIGAEINFKNENGFSIRLTKTKL